MTPVLVAGAGPSGLVAALTLLRNGVPVRIIDKESDFRIGQGASGLWPRTFEVLHLLRVHEVYQRAARVPPIREYKPGTLEPIKTFQLDAYHDPTPSIPYNNPLLLGQPILEAILRSHIERLGCSIELGTELQSFENDGERVRAKLVKKTNGVEAVETFEASYLIGADGAKGVTRKQLGLTFLGQTRSDIPSLVGDVCVEIEGVDREHWHFFGDRRADFCMFRPTDDIAPDGFRMLMTLKDYEPKDLVANEKLMFKCISGLIGREIKVRKVVVLSELRLNIRMVNTFGQGQAFVAGGMEAICLDVSCLSAFDFYETFSDAAHVHSSTGGQGLNAGVQDALNLAWKLALVYKGLSPRSLLDSYTTERLPVIAEMLDITTGMLEKVRNEPKTERAMGRDRRLNMLGVNCRSSPIVVDEFTHAEPTNAYGDLDEGVLVAGDRAPDAPALTLVASGAETKLFDVFGPTHHTVLVFTPDVSATDVFDILRKYPRNVIKPVIVLPQGSSDGTGVQQEAIVVDRGGHAYRGYLAVDGEPKVVVVRPDGVVGAIVRGAQGLQAYLDKIFV